MQDTELNQKQSISTLRVIIFGFIIGMGAIIPGLSGGILAISLGLYPRIISSITNLRSKFKDSISFLIPFGIGALLGMFAFGVVMKPLLENYERSVIWLFMGLIAGSIPSLIKEATKKGFRIMHLIPMLVAFALGMILTTATEQTLSVQEFSPLMMILGGGILAIGSIVPGMSSSFILIQMGIYDKIITAFTGFDLYCIFWIALGAVIFFIATVKLINMAFAKFHGYAYFAAFGFLLSTMVAVFPGINSFADVLIFVVGIAVICLFNKFTKQKNISG